MEFDPNLGRRWWFWAIAAVLATCQGIRGALLQRDLVGQLNTKRGANGPLSRPAMILAYQVPDVILNVACTIAGFVALAVISRIMSSVADPSQIGLGAGVFLSALLFVVVSGIAGVLPLVLWRGTYPGAKS